MVAMVISAYYHLPSLPGLMLVQHHFCVHVCTTLVCACLDATKCLRNIFLLFPWAGFVLYVLLGYVSCISKPELLIWNGYSHNATVQGKSVK